VPFTEPLADGRRAPVPVARPGVQVLQVVVGQVFEQQAAQVRALVAR